ncbi:beta-lactamase superfamily II metal-dependent hydrolase [Sphingomonas sp. SORGH_AS438]|nr:beta-lactamase superfamily II metal-dependent hydrolase [Sphingomonas sp. SORGH_AS_0438]
MHVAMLDMGNRKYGDATYCNIDGVSVLVDGGHRGDEVSSARMPASVPDQLKLLTGHDGPYAFDLIVITHCHSDHIGCIPELVANGTITARWALFADARMGFGVPLGQDFPSTPSTQVSRVAAALREEPLPDSAGDDEIAYLIDTAATLQERYAGLIETLRRQGTKVVQFGRDPHYSLEKAFDGIGFKILGPTVDQLLICAYRIERDRSRRLAESNALPDMSSEVALYRALVAQRAADDESMEDGGVGAALNNQSILLKIGTGNRSTLLTGDMQFASPGIGGLAQRMGLLRQTVRNAGPYRFVRLAHHGASNGTDEAFLNDCQGTQFFGISTGAGDPSHPSKVVLDLLGSRADELRWARTDRNGLTSLRLDEEYPQFQIAKGLLNDVDQARKHVSKAAPQLGRVGKREPRNRRNPTSADAASRLEGLPSLTFVTNSGRLRDRIGDGADLAVDLIRSARHEIIDLREDLPPHDIAQLAKGSNGLVILGGYEVIPPNSVDTLPKRARDEWVDARGRDPDNCVVWTDDFYGDVNGSGLAELPVSRIPDGRDPDLLMRALAARPTGTSPAFGLRNVRRPFADAIFQGFAGNEKMHLSEPTLTGSVAADLIDADHVYLMLHGRSDDGTTFRGEFLEDPLDGGECDALSLSDIPASTGALVFAGCCYGALTCHEPAWPKPKGAITDRLASESLALSFIRAGARAFVGVTGVHYSPPEEPYDSAGAPFHRFFWQHVMAGKAPAVALMQAKIDYVFAMSDVVGRMGFADHKTWRQFTCLGLGW